MFYVGSKGTRKTPLPNLYCYVRVFISFIKKPRIFLFNISHFPATVKGTASFSVIIGIVCTNRMTKSNSFQIMVNNQEVDT